MQKKTHYGVYGLIIKDNQIVLIKKANGPYKGKLDLPGGTIEFGETPENTLIREIKEEVGINVKSYSVFDNNSVIINWNHKGEDESLHHIGMFYKINSYSGALKQSVLIDKNNDDSLGAKFYDINKLSKSKLSEIAILEINKLGYTLKE